MNNTENISITGDLILIDKNDASRYIVITIGKNEPYRSKELTDLPIGSEYTDTSAGVKWFKAKSGWEKMFPIEINTEFDDDGAVKVI